MKLLSPVMTGVQTRLAMKMPINDIDDVGLVMNQFISQYGAMPEMKIPDMIPYKLVDKSGKSWKPTSVGATLLTDLPKGNKGDSDYFNVKMKAIRPCHPYHVYSPGLSVPGEQGNLVEMNNVWSTNVARRLPLQARGLSGKMYGKRMNVSSNLEFVPVGLNGLGNVTPSEGFETNNSIGLPKASMVAAVVGMLAPKELIHMNNTSSQNQSVVMRRKMGRSLNGSMPPYHPSLGKAFSRSANRFRTRKHR